MNSILDSIATNIDALHTCGYENIINQSNPNTFDCATTLERTRKR